VVLELERLLNSSKQSGIKIEPDVSWVEKKTAFLALTMGGVEYWVAVRAALG
jgi:hypothetical protein